MKKTVLKYDLISAAAVLLFCASYILNIGWYRLLIGIVPAVLLCLFMFLGCHFILFANDPVRAKRLNVLSYVLFISAQLLMPDCNDEEWYVFFRLIRRVDDDVIFFVFLAVSTVLFVANVAVIIVQTVIYEKYRRGGSAKKTLGAE